MIVIIVLVVLLVGVLGYVGFDKYSEKKLLQISNGKIMN